MHLHSSAEAIFLSSKFLMFTEGKMFNLLGLS